MQLIEVIGILAIITSAFRVSPQIIKSYQTKKVRDVSVIWEIFGATSTFLWVWYAYLKADWFLLAGAGSLFVCYIILLIQHKIYE